MIKWHIFLSTLAFFMMCIAAVQAIVIAIQDGLLRRSQTKTFHHWPPLETMEKWLFRIITLGFILLSLTLITSIIFFHPVFSPPLRQKSILTLIAWSVFAGLLAGRFYWGFRGRVAIRWTLAGTFLLMLIYCGTGLLLNGH